MPSEDTHDENLFGRVFILLIELYTEQAICEKIKYIVIKLFSVYMWSKYGLLLKCNKSK